MTVHLGTFYLHHGLRTVDGEPEVQCLAVGFDLTEMIEFATERSQLEAEDGFIAFRIINEGGVLQDLTVPSTTHQTTSKAQ